MGRGVQLGIKFAFLIIFSQHFCPELSEKQEQNERDSSFKIDKKFREKGSDCHNMITVVKLPCQEMNALSAK